MEESSVAKQSVRREFYFLDASSLTILKDKKPPFLAA
jgi:hypothetical protein